MSLKQERDKRYYNKHKTECLIRMKKYRQTEKYKASRRKSYQKNKEKILKRVKEYQLKNNEKRRLYNKKYFKKHYSEHKDYYIIKANKRRRNLNWVKLFENPFDESEVIDWHHINNTYVVAVPRDLHQLYYGENHREKVMTVLQQIYGDLK